MLTAKGAVEKVEMHIDGVDIRIAPQKDLLRRRRHRLRHRRRWQVKVGFDGKSNVEFFRNRNLDRRFVFKVFTSGFWFEMRDPDGASFFGSGYQKGAR